MGEKQKKQDIRSDLLLLAALIAWAFFVNRQFRISGLYKDDLYTWSCWGEQSFWQYAFPQGSTRCRFVYWAASWLELQLIGHHIDWIVPFNILLNAGLAVFLYLFAKRLSGNRAVAFAVGFCFSALTLPTTRLGSCSASWKPWASSLRCYRPFSCTAT